MMARFTNNKGEKQNDKIRNYTNYYIGCVLPVADNLSCRNKHSYRHSRMERYTSIFRNGGKDQEMKKELYGVYAPNWDMTFIMEDIFNEKGDIVSTECVGWYYGEPNDKDNETFKGKLKGEYN